jgi:AcrR family transcriptional regulator
MEDSAVKSSVNDVGEPTGRGRRSAVDELIEATWKVAAKPGSVDPSVRDILEYSGLSTKALYRNFQSKDELLMLALDRGASVLVEHLEDGMAKAADPLSKVGIWIEEYVRSQTMAVSPNAKSPPWALLSGRFAAAFPEQLDSYQSRITAPLERAIESAVADGSGWSPDPSGDARLIFGYSTRAVRSHLLDQSIPSSESLSQLVDFARRALSPGLPH